MRAALSVAAPLSVESFAPRVGSSRVIPKWYPLGEAWEISISAGGRAFVAVQLDDSGPSRLVAVRLAVADAASLLADPRGVEVEILASDGRELVERVPVSHINGNQGGELLSRVPYLLGRGTVVNLNFYNLESVERRISGFLRAYLFERGNV